MQIPPQQKEHPDYWIKETIDYLLKNNIPFYPESEVEGCEGNKKVEIKTGVRNQGNIEILDGLVEGDKIIAEGLTKVRPGMKVKPIIKSQ